VRLDHDPGKSEKTTIRANRSAEAMSKAVSSLVAVRSAEKLFFAPALVKRSHGLGMEIRSLAGANLA
jgi:hypothetical protein